MCPTAMPTISPKRFLSLEPPSVNLSVHKSRFDLPRQIQKNESREFGKTAHFGPVLDCKISEHKMSIASPQESELCSPARRSFVSDENTDNFRYTFFPKSEESEAKTSGQKWTTKPSQDTGGYRRSNYRLPKIVINKKNFIFKDAIEQIRKERRKKSGS